MKTKLEAAAEARYFTAKKMEELGATLVAYTTKEDRINAIIEKLERIADKFGTASILLNNAVEQWRGDDVDDIIETMEVIEGVVPKEVLALEGVLNLGVKAKKLSKEDAKKSLGL